MSTLMQSLTSQRTGLETTISQTKREIQDRYGDAALARAANIEAERQRVATMRNEIQQQQMSVFVQRQNGVRDQIQAQIDSGLAELRRLQTEVSKLSADEQERVAAIRVQPRADLLTQTLALHGLFDHGHVGGHFALMAYLVLAALFMLVDVIPLIVKSFSKPGPYDAMVDYDEMRYGGLRTAAAGPCDQFHSNLNVSDQFQFAHSNNLLEAMKYVEDSTRPAAPEVAAPQKEQAPLEEEPAESFKPINGSEHAQAGRHTVLDAVNSDADDASATRLDAIPSGWMNESI